DQEPNPPTLTLAGDPPGPAKCLYVRGSGYRLDYRPELHESLCKTVEYSAKLGNPDSSVVYAQVRMGTDGQPDRDGWIAHKFDTTAGTRKENSVEWTILLSGEALSKSGWRSFTWSLPDEVKRTFGNEGGWVYK